MALIQGNKFFYAFDPNIIHPRCDFMWKGSKGLISSAMKTKWSIHDHNDNNHEQQIRSFGRFKSFELFREICMKAWDIFKLFRHQFFSQFPDLPSLTFTAFAFCSPTFPRPKNCLSLCSMIYETKTLLSELQYLPPTFYLASVTFSKVFPAGLSAILFKIEMEDRLR